MRFRRKIFPILALLAIIPFLVASCGSSGNTNESSASTTKLPPGADSSVSSDDSSSTTQTTTESTTTTQTDTSSASTTKTVSLGGVNFTVSKAARDDSNSVVSTNNTRQVDGDFLEIAISIENASGALAPLSGYSFRLYSPGITASQYDDYYGSTGTYGAYVSSHVISASLLDYSSLSAVTYTLREGETVDEVFLFFDLNPQSTTKNESVTKDNTNLIIKDTSTGSKVEVNLAGFAD
jgi:hypothetical protein